MNTIKLSHEFPITLTINQAIELKRRGLMDVFELPTSPEQLQSIIADPVLFSNVLWEMTDKSRFTYDTFCELLSSVEQKVTWEAATTAIVEFFPYEMRSLIKALFVNVRDARNDAAKRMLNSLKQSGELNTSERTAEIGNLSGTWQVSSESILGPLRVANSIPCSSADSVPSGSEQAS